MPYSWYGPIQETASNKILRKTIIDREPKQAKNFKTQIFKGLRNLGIFYLKWDKGHKFVNEAIALL